MIVAGSGQSDMGDSGEELGDVSLMLQSSASDKVVVGDGDELDDSEDDVETLSSWECVSGL